MQKDTVRKQNSLFSEHIRIRLLF